MKITAELSVSYFQNYSNKRIHDEYKIHGLLLYILCPGIQAESKH